MLKIAFMLLSLPPAESQFAVCHYPFATHGPAPVYRGDSHATHSAPGLASCVSGSRRAHCGRVSGHPGGGGLRPCGLGHCLPPGAFGPRTSPWDLSCRGGGGGVAKTARGRKERFHPEGGAGREPTPPSAAGVRCRGLGGCALGRLPGAHRGCPRDGVASRVCGAPLLSTGRSEGRLNFSLLQIPLPWPGRCIAPPLFHAGLLNVP